MFSDRTDAGRRLALLLDHLRSEDVVVVGLPRGGVPVAFEVARQLGAPLDVIVVRKLGVPFQPELGMGAVGEDGVRVVNEDVVGRVGITANELAAVEARERASVERRAEEMRRGRSRVPLNARTVVVVDDGIATGSTARAACEVARAEGAARVILAVPVAPLGWEARLEGVADETVCVATPDPFFAIGIFYDDFTQVSDAEVTALLDRSLSWSAARTGGTVTPDNSVGDDPPSTGLEADEEVLIDVDEVSLAGYLTVPAGATGVVVFAHGSGSSRHSPRNRYVASVMNEAGLATLLFDLLTPDEEQVRANVFDIELLATRLEGVTAWLERDPRTEGLAVGIFGASTGAGAALWAAASPDSTVAAVVSRGGRPDLAGDRLCDVRAPVLLIVGGYDDVVIGLNEEARRLLRCESRLEIVPGASHLFEEPGTLHEAAVLARDWFVTRMSPVVAFE